MRSRVLATLTAHRRRRARRQRMLIDAQRHVVAARGRANSSASSKTECRADAAPASSPASCAPTAPPASPVTATGNGRPLDGDTVFEIGSITKTFTATLLALMVQRRRRSSFDDPVASLLPDGHVGAEPGRSPDHARGSGDPHLGAAAEPGNLDAADPDNPYADYTVTQLYDFLASYELTTDPGSHFEYSNVGVALLGHALALRAGIPFEDLVRTRILEPLHMTSTGITLDPATAQPIRRRPRRPRQCHLPLRHGSARRRRRPPILRERHAEVRGRQPRPRTATNCTGRWRRHESPAAHRRRRPRDRARLGRRPARRQHDHLARRRHRRLLRLPRPRPRFTTPPQSSSATRAPRTSKTSASTSSTPPSRSSPADAAHRSRAVPRGPRPLRR